MQGQAGGLEVEARDQPADELTLILFDISEGASGWSPPPSLTGAGNSPFRFQRQIVSFETLKRFATCSTDQIVGGRAVMTL